MNFKTIYRSLSFHRALHKKITTNTLSSKNLKSSSKQWLARQLSDPYVEKARTMNLRCRSAFKLIEMDDRFKFLAPGQIVIDCGASPGSWTQVAVQRVNANQSQTSQPVGKVFAIDKQQIFPIQGATTFGNMDFTLDESQNILKTALNNLKANVVLSDMAPSATGISSLDTENIINLCYSVLRFAVQMTQVGGTILVKLWQCGETKQLETDIGRYYKMVRIVKPNSSRADSAEIFILGREFKGLKVS